MTLIFSEEDDFQTNHVVDWFLYSDNEVKRYNGYNLTKKKGEIDFDFRQFNYSIDFEEKYSLEILSERNNIINFESLWFRRPYNGVQDFDFIDSENDMLDKEIWYNSLMFNNKTFKDFLAQQFYKKNFLGSYEITSLNKPKILELANNIGLKIPKTLITNNREKVKVFFEKCNCSIICKALHEAFRFVPKDQDYWISNKTVIIDDLKNLPDEFGLSIFQENINKRYEIRSFYIGNTFYSACIFSQQNDKTKGDFRNYDRDKPNRIVPFQLPHMIEKKIKKLFDKIELNTGSIDIIRNIDGEYIFLEINPVGQYGFISSPCNFNIDHKIYKYLVNE